MQQRGFTLVELSIVLVILGLLIGGVLTGQSLIRAAELRSVSTQYSRYITAVQTFRDKYFALPGDMTNAQSYWGTAASCPGDYTTPSTDATTCNGNGDGQILLSTMSNEIYRFWQQLASAGLIEGSYSGESDGTYASTSTAKNSPPGRISSSMWKIGYTGTSAGSSKLFAGNYGNVLVFGGINPNNTPGLPILKPEEAYNIDVKLDDGMPATGSITIFANNGISTCTDTSVYTTLTANYLLNSSTLACAFFFRNVF